MADYWESGANGAEATGAAQPAGDATMDDEILVSCSQVQFEKQLTNNF